jgi:transcriptional regulator with XRE-family HTH domain
MDFGSWLKQMRLERNMDLRTFANLVGINMSSVSRIENTRIQVTLSTAVHICERLEVTLFTLMQAMQGKALHDLEPPVIVEHEEILTTSDVQTFLEYISYDWHGGSTLLAELLNAIFASQTGPKSIPSGKNTHPFGPEDVNKLLIDVPLYRFELQYPQAIQAHDIWETYCKGGWLTFIDMGVYIKKVRKDVTFVRLRQNVHVSESVITRLESGSLERIKLIDVIMLDEQLDQGGKLLAMYWKTAQLSDELGQFLSQSKRRPTDFPFSMWKEQQVRLSEILTIICRWLQCGSQQERSLIADLHRKLEELTPRVDVVRVEGKTSL